MKKITKVLSIIMVLAMLLTMTGIFASAAPTSGSITITNASIGETYSIVKLFDAAVAGTDNGPIVYTGTIPTELASYFTQDSNGYITSVKSHLSEQAISAMTAWAKTQTATATTVATADQVVFDNLQFGYYIVISSLGTAISVNSTNPDVEIKDKNGTTWDIRKGVDDTDVYIGQTVTYTLDITTTNFFYDAVLGVDEKVTKYVIHDTLPEFLSNVTVTAITIGGVAQPVQQFDNNKEIIIPWVDAAGNHLYNNKSVITITYTAVVTDKAAVDGAGNLNELTVSVYVKDGDTEKKKEEKKDDVTIFTYAVAMKKVDEHNNPLAGAQFTIKGLTVTGSKGNYIVTAYDPASTANGTTMETDDNGDLIIRGVPSGPLYITELKAPDGYNLLKDPVKLDAVKIGETIIATSKTIYYDEQGNVTSEVTSSYKNVVEYNTALAAIATKVVNHAGSELPETGGIGTTMFILFGYFTAVAFAVVLVARKKTAGYR